MKLWKSRKGASCGTSGSEASPESATTTTTGCVSSAGGTSSSNSSTSKGGILSKSCKFVGGSSKQANGTGGSFDEGSAETSFTSNQPAGQGVGPANGTVVMPAMVQHPATSMFSDRAMSPAQSEDSGLAADRGTAYATIAIPRFDSGQPGIVLAERLDLSFPPVVESISGPVADLLAPGDRIHQVDGISTVGLSNAHILGLLGHGADGPAMIEIEYSFPEYISQNSLCVTTKIAQITVEREHGCLGLTLRGGGEYPLVVTNVRPNGPVFRTGQIKPGDRVLRVDNVSLLNKSLPEAQRILKEEAHTSGYTSLTIEYDVSVMQTVELSMGPLLLEIERPLNERLGLILSHYAGAVNLNHELNPHHYPYGGVGAAGYHQPDGIFIASILPASIADRCGALSVGDQILAIDEAIVDNGACTLEEATALLDANCAKGYTQLHMLPAHTFVRRRGVSCSSPRYGFNTVDSRKNLIGGPGGPGGPTAAAKNRRLLRKSSLPQSMEPQLQAPGPGPGPQPPPVGLCKTEQIHIILDCSQGSGICLGPKTACGRGYVIAQVLPDSVAERSGCLQPGDRITAINKLCHLDAATVRQILGDSGPAAAAAAAAAAVAANHYHNQPPTAHWVELEIEFDMADTVVPASGVFNIKLLKHARYGLGITVNATNHGTFMVAEVKPGSAAHRTGSLRAGDQLLAVDNRPLQHYNLDLLLKESQHELITLTVKRCSLPDFLFDPHHQQQQQHRTAGGGGAGLYGDAEDIDYGYSGRYEAKPLSSQACERQDGRAEEQQGQDDQGGQEGQEEEEEEEEEVQLRRPVWSATSSYDASASGALPLPPPHLLLASNEGGPGGEGRSEDRYDDILHYKMASMNISNSNYVGYGQHHHHYQQQQQQQRINPSEQPLDAAPLFLASPGPEAGSPVVPHGHRVFSVRLEPHGGPLGITLAASDDLQKPIRISALTEGGIAHSTGQLQVGDWLLAINGESIAGVPLTTATKLLHRYDHAVDLQMARPPPSTTVRTTTTTTRTTTPPPPPGPGVDQTAAAAVYAKVQRRPRSPGSQAEAASGTSGTSTGAGSGSAGGPGHHRTMQVTLFKDRVYDDYGFSVSDGLYERGVYINRIRSGGPADLGSLLRPFDRIVQVNGTKTQDFDCCLTVPLIAAAGDKIELVIQRTLPE
ncbi:glutamate receptor-interacting protein 1-like [Anopheles albimanus]|nr:glutamate receptor-interacting protein 1-like [Anopheles albimanus]XP_035793959.1 glutamate receptor-interacting protein 1-like [Anopheles albimanus]XP_035794047.1 glutamate receptor-interacting protein 1-like [Anopheles albimanus]XP_035794133.1 glutamate receptor-interacting protein 1-like [Anopheles albimanus]XP_035794225.1 glutamate receptor-interacting protein 1-like [Anopheles albimanus]XP_035794314.1 glutamate receptor-interacting protein 1-like [Anopheles albimanus]XP_035794401.1 gl